MTQIRQVVFSAFAGCVGVLLFGAGVCARAQQQPLTEQRPAPVVRVDPYHRTLPHAEGAIGQLAHPRPATAATGQLPTRRPETRPRAGEGVPASGSTGLTGHSAPAHTPLDTGLAAVTHAAATRTEAASPAIARPEAAHAASRLSAAGLNRNVIVLDPAHGGADSGARIGDSILEKNVTLALAFRLRSLLAARGFTVILTRDSDAALNPTTSTSVPASPLTLDDRAGIANHGRAAACLLLHATGRGLGVHLYSSELDPVPAEAYTPPWLTAQAAWIPASQALEGQLGSALGRSRVPLLSSSASVRPVDSLTCPAVVVELAPESDRPASINDAGYQERVAAALAGALVVWENAVQAPPKLPPPPRPVHHTDADTTTADTTTATEAQP